MPNYAVERSRSQVLCRTGFRGPGQSVKLGYGKGEAFTSEKRAVAAAKKWVAAERAKQGLKD